ncbi:hypothetical protein, variant 2 [Saprolegnia diclina VS20]|uniref:Uncharacterized protein n=1 Tax=Saprolegnia diclina (strain VS20) TaxID=1156394 RepID=T0Q4F7_SAPDV|nr:hypothetical protein, variant 2 [Saprolegnia diclina VS20]EQC32719.1 hypothetical protein, variant 2 [Saprolegnia diclina VS20]|eukprot:XP_008613862.1 hypothetical protein, variant 2 [Saprolegnia diclina VS20]
MQSPASVASPCSSSWAHLSSPSSSSDAPSSVVSEDSCVGGHWTHGPPTIDPTCYSLDPVHATSACWKLMRHRVASECPCAL